MIAHYQEAFREWFAADVEASKEKFMTKQISTQAVLCAFDDRQSYPLPARRVSIPLVVLLALFGLFGFAAAGRAQTAVFSGTDTNTQGSWNGEYGTDGYTVVTDGQPVTGNPVVTPAYSSAVTEMGANPYCWIDAYGDGRALSQSATTLDRIAATWYNTPGTSFAIDVPITDTKTHQVALYLLDWDNHSRAETVQVQNAATGAVLDTRQASSFAGGEYLIWNVTGHVKFVVTVTSGNNAVVSGVFFDPPATTTPTVTLGEINVTQYGAVADGKTDNTAAFQKALVAAGHTGAIVKVPAGQYLFSGSLNVPPQVVLKGVDASERTYSGYSSGTSGGEVTANIGTVFLVTGGAGSTTGTPFLTLKANSALRNVTIFYPNQPRSTSSAYSPTPYPTTINMVGINSSVDYVCGINPYTFITKSVASINGNAYSVRTDVRHVTGQPLYRGIVVSQDLDETHFENIHFGESWDNGPSMTAYMLDPVNGPYAFAFYRMDGLKLADCSATTYNRGFYLGFDTTSYQQGSTQAGFQGCSAENCTDGVWIDALQQQNVTSFHGCAFSSNLSTNGEAVRISNSPGTDGYVVFDGCRFSQANGPLIVNQATAGGSAPGASVMIEGCSFDAWGAQFQGTDPASTAIVCGDQGNPNNASGKTIIADCSFNLDKYAYAYTPGEQGVLFEGNTTVNGVRYSASGAAPASPTGRYYRVLASGNSNYAMDDENFGNANRNPVQVYQASGDTAQQWMLIPNSDGTFGMSPACAPGLGLDDFMGNSVYADIFQINPGDSHTEWNLLPLSASSGTLTIADGAYNIQSAATGQWLDVPGANYNNGIPLDFYTTSQSSAQSWLLSYQAGYVQTNND